jgi:hypothetical protein
MTITLDREGILNVHPDYPGSSDAERYRLAQAGRYAHTSHESQNRGRTVRYRHKPGDRRVGALELKAARLEWGSMLSKRA